MNDHLPSLQDRVDALAEHARKVTTPCYPPVSLHWEEQNCTLLLYHAGPGDQRRLFQGRKPLRWTEATVDDQYIMRFPADLESGWCTAARKKFKSWVEEEEESFKAYQTLKVADTGYVDVLFTLGRQTSYARSSLAAAAMLRDFEAVHGRVAAQSAGVPFRPIRIFVALPGLQIGMGASGMDALESGFRTYWETESPLPSLVPVLFACPGSYSAASGAVDALAKRGVCPHVVISTNFDDEESNLHHFMRSLSGKPPLLLGLSARSITTPELAFSRGTSPHIKTVLVGSNALVEPPALRAPASTNMHLGILHHRAADVVIGYPSLDLLYDSLQTDKEHLVELKSCHKVVVITTGSLAMMPKIIEAIIEVILHKPSDGHFYLIASLANKNMNADLKQKLFETRKGVMVTSVALAAVLQDPRVEYIITRGGWSTVGHDIGRLAAKPAFFVAGGRKGGNCDREANGQLWTKEGRGAMWFHEFPFDQIPTRDILLQRLLAFEHPDNFRPMQKKCTALKQALVGPVGQEMDREEWMKLLVMIHKHAGRPQEHGLPGQIV